ncbi:BCL2/adenovirus E1B 19 kDa protein-interacting protein 3-like [Lethenteron reissneri]|uniref:BCL2/adenovirus E1B 19 kDa protein-interacting protein 3-like n=1 Tax=Lethenteron reissneri TaxID=7753 RepID=UPI002AB78704|nr:BCL2/adenovirus E1B 19 kDa protein-interacting protein 3-like [Lethenteron reissneri]
MSSPEQQPPGHGGGGGGSNDDEEEGGGGLEHVPSSASIHDEDVMEQILLDAQHESERNSPQSRSHSHSPQKPQSPVFFSCGPESSNAEETFLGEGGGGVFSCGLESGEALGTPPQSDGGSRQSDEESGDSEAGSKRSSEWSSRPENSPPKELKLHASHRAARTSVRKSSAVNSGGLFSSEVLCVIVPSLLLSHLLTLGLGIYIGKRLAASSHSSL